MEQEKVNQIAKQLGLTLISAGTKMLRSAFHINPIKVPSYEIEKFLQTKIQAKNVTLSDGKYWLIPFYQWKEIIKVDWTDKKKYLVDRYDCDNFAFTFASRASEVFDINSAGVVHGHVYNKDTGKWIGGHFWNAIITKEGGSFNLYFYEPINDNYTLYTGGKIIMGMMEYRPLSYRFF